MKTSPEPAGASRVEGEQAYQESVLALMQLKSVLYGSRVALSLKEEGCWKELTYAELSRGAKDLSDHLIRKGFRRGERIAILSESRPEWGVAFFAAIRSGAIVVPLDTKWTPAELASILSDAEPRLLFVSSQFVETARALKTQLPFLEEVILLHGGPQATGLGIKSSDPAEFPTIDRLRARGDDAVPPLQGKDREMDETALIVYTSGTTGSPKGVMISFRNLISQIRSFEALLGLSSQDLFLSMLPLNHLLELTVGFLGVLYAGGRICYSRTLYPQEITEIMRERGVSLVITVPLFLKMLKGCIEKEVRRSGILGERLFHMAFGLARWIPGRLMKKLLFRRIHRQFGGRLRAFISGGAPLEGEVAEFFDRLGFPIYQGYGLTETSPVISVNTPEHNRLGSVGRPLSGVRVRILSEEGKGGEGEILTQGPHVMKGYYKREDLTREVLDAEGWLHTGDLGRIDEDGFLYLTGRVKNLIVLGGGKKVHPEEVEAALARSSVLKEVCVIGKLSQEGPMRGTEEVWAVVVPSEALVQSGRGNPEALKGEIQRDMDRLLRDLAPYKRPSRIFISFEELPKTATRKIKRGLVLQGLEGREGLFLP